MRTADRILADGLRPPPALQALASSAPARRLWDEQQQGTLDAIDRGPSILADNIAGFVHDQEWVLEEMPCLAPPWPSFWIEYPSYSGRQRRGVLVTDVSSPVTELAQHYDNPALEELLGEDGAFRGAIKDARANGYDGEVKWVVDCAVFIEDERHNVAGPMGWLVLALDLGGRCVGNRWVINSQAGPQVVDRFEAGGHKLTVNDTWLLSAAGPALQAISFLHCRNVVVDPVLIPDKVAAKHTKRHGRPPLRFQTVRLEVPRRSGSGGSTGTGESPSLHIVAGNFAHYGDCCPGPGGHAPKGLLFGHLEGIYWKPQHLRGDPKRGAVVTDFDLIPEPAYQGGNQ